MSFEPTSELCHLHASATVSFGRGIPPAMGPLAAILDYGEKGQRAGLWESCAVSPAIVGAVAGAMLSATPVFAESAQNAATARTDAASSVTAAGHDAADLPNTTARENGECDTPDARHIVVCAQRPQGYRLDPSVIEANREADVNHRSAGSRTPAAQSVCSSQPMGCGEGLGSLDLVNVAIVAGTIAVKAAKGEDWKKAFRVGGPDEYQLYQAAKRKREAEEADRAAARAKVNARAAQSAPPERTNDN
ncbi:MAG TPA: hypothetical protein VGU01_15195 [Sphingomicrobium sp.]|nr:hypothetical protein [Sphingomicrobium sp.]